MPTELCPGCSKRYQDPATGLCDICHTEKTRNQYLEDDHAQAELRRDRWRDRQRRHRERARFRPEEPVAEDADPLELVAAALDMIDGLEKDLANHPSQEARFDELREQVKRLGWGPEDESENRMTPDPIEVDRNFVKRLAQQADDLAEKLIERNATIAALTVEIARLERDSKFVRHVRAFHEAFNVVVRDVPVEDGTPEWRLRRALIDEEINDELLPAIDRGDVVEIADAIADSIYVLIGTALTYGIPLDAVWDEVHASNMSKLGDDGKPVYREDGKVMKGPNWHPPRVAELLERARR